MSKHLEAAVISLVNSQAKLVDTQAKFVDTQARFAERQQASDQRWLEMRNEMDEILRILHEHTRILKNLPDAMQKKVGLT